MKQMQTEAGRKLAKIERTLRCEFGIIIILAELSYWGGICILAVAAGISLIWGFYAFETLIASIPLIIEDEFAKLAHKKPDPL